MTWNWQQPDWPDFSWDSDRLRRPEADFVMGSGLFAGSVRHLAAPDREGIIIEVLATDAVKTSEIEGEILSRASVQSSIREQLGLGKDRRRIPPAEQGIAEMMVDLYRSFAEPLSDGMLFRWHRMMFPSRSDLRDVGRYRTGGDPMQVVSGASYTPKVHFEAPPSSEVRKQMAQFVKWFNRTEDDGSDSLPAVTRAGIAHLYFESIHPFEDGNGRIGRAIAEKALAQNAGQANLTALAETIQLRRKEYYTALEAANQRNEVTGWLIWFAGMVLDAQKRAIALVEFTIEKTRLLDRLRGQLNERQEKALLRMLREGPEGFHGGLSAGNYAKITGASPATTTRDLAGLVDKGALVRSGELRHARYRLAISTGR